MFRSFRYSAPPSMGLAAQGDAQLWPKQAARGPSAFWQASSILPRQPPMRIRVELAGLKQPPSSASSPAASLTPFELQAPVCGWTPLQYSKWPISSEKATL